MLHERTFSTEKTPQYIMETCDIGKTWDAFHYAAIIFYGAYGLLCCFVPELYSKHIYFRGRWKQFHSKDEIFWYFVIGAGEGSIHMSLLTLFVYKFANPGNSGMLENRSWLKGYLVFQFLSWIKWMITEAYYTYKGVEWSLIGYIHVFFCGIVLSLAIENYLCVVTTLQ